ncbi:MAG TPA: pyridoxal phosphate-dependent aminotransferase [Nitrososphaerales archaeon]|nr:pyridoxal phosphate-dependent aminotransferase [Nitrososphaerales archaeon]
MGNDQFYSVFLLTDYFSDWIPYVQKSGIREIFDLAEKMPNLINLGIGEPDFKTPSFINAAAKRALDRGFSRYTTNAGILELRQELARKLKHENGIEADPKKEIIVTSGATQAIFVLMNCLLNPGEEVILPTPLFSAYKYSVRIAGGVPIEVPMDQRNGFSLDVGRLQSAVSSRSKILVINSPCNPTGAVFPKDKIVEACEFAQRNKLFIVSDEIYEDFLYGNTTTHFSPASLPEFSDRVITINGFSKKYAMTGWRIGYAAGNEEIIRVMTLFNMYNAVCASSFVQLAALEALRHSQAFFKRILKIFEKRRSIACKMLREMGFEFVEPRGAFYVFPTHKGVRMSSQSFCKDLLVKKQVSTIPGTAFGDAGEGHIRISYSVREEKLAEALLRIKKYLKTISK